MEAEPKKKQINSCKWTCGSARCCCQMARKGRHFRLLGDAGGSGDPRHATDPVATARVWVFSPDRAFLNRCTGSRLAWAGWPLATQLRRFLCTQFTSQDLTGLTLRNVVDDLHLPWVLVPGHPLLAEGDDLLRCGRSARLERDKGLNRLAEVSIGHSNHGRFRNSWMEQQAFLDLHRRDLVANHADHIAFHRFPPGR